MYIVQGKSLKIKAVRSGNRPNGEERQEEVGQVVHPYWVMCSVHCTVHCILYTVQFKVYSIPCSIKF